MKLWRVKQGISPVFWTYAITNDKGTRLTLEGEDSTTGIDDLSTLTEIGGAAGKIDLYIYDIVVEGFNSLEELKKLVPEEFV